MSVNELFFELIRVAIGTQDTLSRPPSEAEWTELYSMSKKQSLVGICFAGLQKLYYFDNQEPSTHNPQPDSTPDPITKNHTQETTHNPEPITQNLNEVHYLTWMGMTAQINMRNEQVNGYTEKALNYFRAFGFPCVVLKGQGVGSLYKVKCNAGQGINVDDHLSLYRQSGDVDVWVNCNRKELYELSMKEFGKVEGVTYHHIHYPLYEDCEVEAHIYPSFLHNFIRNKKLHHFFDLYRPDTDSGDTPSMAFNRVYILLHIYNHFCGHGVGMRQLLDYYFVLCQGFSEEERGNTISWIRTFGMLRFAKAVMWFLKFVFGLEDCFLLTECNEKDGRFLLDEVMHTGNMGHWDHRVDHSKYRTPFGRYMQNFKRDLYVASFCPDSALCEPFWGIYQFLKVKIIQLHYNK